MKTSILAATLLALALNVQAEKYGRGTGYRVAPKGKLGTAAVTPPPKAAAPKQVRRNEAPAPEAPAGPAPQAGAKIMPVISTWEKPSQSERVAYPHTYQPDATSGYAINSGGRYLTGAGVNGHGSFQPLTMGNGQGKQTHQSWINELNNVTNNNGNTRINGNAHNNNSGNGKK